MYVGHQVHQFGLLMLVEQVARPQQRNAERVGVLLAQCDGDLEAVACTQPLEQAGIGFGLRDVPCAERLQRSAASRPGTAHRVPPCSMRGRVVSGLAITTKGSTILRVRAARSCAPCRPCRANPCAHAAAGLYRPGGKRLAFDRWRVVSQSACPSRAKITLFPLIYYRLPRPVYVMQISAAPVGPVVVGARGSRLVKMPHP
jgi:hypothetical protein